jgi:hypothetical protein
MQARLGICFVIAFFLAACARQPPRETLAAPAVEFKAAVGVSVCTPDGNDPNNVALNHLKNRATVPDDSDALSSDPFTPTQLLSALPNLDAESTRAPKLRSDFSESELSKVNQFEPKAVTVSGYFLDATKEGEESANCSGELGYDWHTWVWSATADTLDGRHRLRTKAIVAEVTPAAQAAHSTWTASKIRALATTQKRVRISGWLLFDPEHPEQLGKTRASRWEVHPITRIEYYDQGQWQDLR